jgi:ATP-dependent Lon protease
MRAIQAAQERQQTVIGVLLRDAEDGELSLENAYPIATEMALGRMMHLPEGDTTVLAQGRRRVELVDLAETDGLLRARARPLSETVEPLRDITALRRAVLNLFQRCVELSPDLPEEAYIYALNIEEPGWLADLIASSLNLDADERREALQMADAVERLRWISTVLGREVEMLELEDKIQMQVRQEIDQSQREYYLREQLRAIQHELGETDIFQQDLQDVRKRAAQAKLSPEAREKTERELARLAMLPPMAPEVGVVRTYLDWLLDLPWQPKPEDNLDLKRAAEILDEEHFGLRKAKDRILEHMAVRQLAPDKMRSPILCFVGPPGTGKTSMGKSIARALGREFVRVSLGGVRDEAEIRGHRRTYIGALPGRIIQTMRRAGTTNPVFMLDEIDKLGMDFRGDPAAALLEVLDPEQNASFSDHYLDVSYDLSQVLFITTANDIDPIPPALLDRMEVIEFPGYTEDEKISIARRFLIPRQLEQHGLEGQRIRFDTSALQEIIRSYTYEAGVRNLEREIAKVCRKLARRLAENKPFPRRITAESLDKYLGPPQIISPLAEERDEVGVATGLAWTEAGGDLMAIEVTLLPGKGMLMLTGQLGDVMQESAQTALSYVRSRAAQFGIDSEDFERLDIHVHLPEGAIPKDGPSAGITLATAMFSALLQKRVRRDVAMTGEITLRGNVLPVGGLREKILTAHRLGVKKVLLPKRNEKDLVELPPRRKLRGLELVLVSHMDEVLEHALLDPLEDGRASPAS